MSEDVENVEVVEKSIEGNEDFTELTESEEIFSKMPLGNVAEFYANPRDIYITIALIVFILLTIIITKTIMHRNNNRNSKNNKK